MTKETVLEKVGSTKVEQVAQEFNLEYFDLKKYSSGPDIEKVLPENHLFSVSEVYSVIGNLIAKQAEGEEGPLKNDGNYNIFYTEKFCVSVYWYSEDGYWDVYTWLREHVWRDINRVFSPGLDS